MGNYFNRNNDDNENTDQLIEENNFNEEDGIKRAL